MFRTIELHFLAMAATVGIWVIVFSVQKVEVQLAEFPAQCKEVMMDNSREPIPLH